MKAMTFLARCKMLSSLAFPSFHCQPPRVWVNNKSASISDPPIPLSPPQLVGVTGTRKDASKNIRFNLPNVPFELPHSRLGKLWSSSGWTSNHQQDRMKFCDLVLFLGAASRTTGTTTKTSHTPGPKELPSRPDMNFSWHLAQVSQSECRGTVVASIG